MLVNRKFSPDILQVNNTAKINISTIQGKNNIEMEKSQWRDIQRRKKSKAIQFTRNIFFFDKFKGK